MAVGLIGAGVAAAAPAIVRGLQSLGGDDTLPALTPVIPRMQPGQLPAEAQRAGEGILAISPDDRAALAELGRREILRQQLEGRILALPSVIAQQQRAAQAQAQGQLAGQVAQSSPSGQLAARRARIGSTAAIGGQLGAQAGQAALGEAEQRAGLLGSLRDQDLQAAMARQAIEEQRRRFLLDRARALAPLEQLRATRDIAQTRADIAAAQQFAARQAGEQKRNFAEAEATQGLIADIGTGAAKAGEALGGLLSRGKGNA